MLTKDVTRARVRPPPSTLGPDTTGINRGASSYLRVVRPTLGIKAGVGNWSFRAGEVLCGALIAHPINAARKTVIRTEQGIFNLNAEDVEAL